MIKMSYVIKAISVINNQKEPMDIKYSFKIIVVFFLFCLVYSTAESNKPNIIFIMADDLGYGDLGSFGQTKIKTPHLDNMAQEGMTFRRFYAGSTVCAPSRCVLMTGLHTGHSRVRGNSDKATLFDEDITISEVLKESGYITGAFGKWGLGNEGSQGIPNKQGFDYFYGYLDQVHAHDYYPEFLIKNEGRDSLRNKGTYNDRGKGQCTTCVDYSHDIITQEALDFIDRNRDTTFFIYIPFAIPHQKFEVPDIGEYVDKSWSEPQKIMAAMVTRMDRDIGKIFDKLKEYNIDRKTIVFFTSDNGPWSGGTAKIAQAFNSSGPLKGRKTDLYEGGIRVPLIVRWPGVIPPATHSPYVGWFPDVMPTLAEFGGIESPAGIDGHSFVPALLGNMDEQPIHEQLYWEYLKSTKVAVIKDGWKALWINDKSELYNMSTDSTETTNVKESNTNVFSDLESTKAAEHDDNTVVATWSKKLKPPVVPVGGISFSKWKLQQQCKVFTVGQHLIISVNEAYTLKLLNTKGHVVFSKQGKNSEKYPLNGIPNGMYWVVIKTKTFEGMKRIAIYI